MSRSKVIMAVCVAVLVTAALPAEAASPTRTIAKKALRLSKQAVGQSEEAIDHSNALDRKWEDRTADTRRDIQSVNGRVSNLPDTFNSNTTHEHAALGNVLPDTRGTVSASCQPDESVVSGGYEFDTNQAATVPQPQVVGERIVGNSWTVTMNNVGSGLTVGLHVYANCIPK